MRDLIKCILFCCYKYVVLEGTYEEKTTLYEMKNKHFPANKRLSNEWLGCSDEGDNMFKGLQQAPRESPYKILLPPVQSLHHIASIVVRKHKTKYKLTFWWAG